MTTSLPSAEPIESTGASITCGATVPRARTVRLCCESSSRSIAPGSLRTVCVRKSSKSTPRVYSFERIGHPMPDLVAVARRLRHRTARLDLVKVGRAVGGDHFVEIVFVREHARETGRLVDAEIASPQDGERIGRSDASGEHLVDAVGADAQIHILVGRVV